MLVGLNCLQEVKKVSAKLIATSKDRYRATASERRLYGGNTVTEFYVMRPEDEKNPANWAIVMGYGPTPGQRKTDAIARARKELIARRIISE